MASDIKLNDNTVILEGNVGIGTNNPGRPLHVEGNEIHSGGSGGGFSFSDRSKPGLVNNPTNGERWVWYAQDGEARLWSGEDQLTISQSGGVEIKRLKVGPLSVEQNLGVKFDLYVDGDILCKNGALNTAVRELKGVKNLQGIPTIRCRTSAIQLEDLTVSITNPPSPPRIALFHDFVNNQKDGLVINHQGRYKDGVRIEGNVKVTGTLTQASSIAFKENVAELSGKEAIEALQGLNAVKYNYKADSQKEQHIGFIAEEVPDLVANSERDRLSPMDLIAVLTKAVQELAVEVNTLKTQNNLV